MDFVVVEVARGRKRNRGLERVRIEHLDVAAFAPHAVVGRRWSQVELAGIIVGEEVFQSTDGVGMHGGIDQSQRRAVFG